MRWQKKSQAFMRGAVTALLCCALTLAGMRLVLADHYSFAVRNVGQAALTATVVMPSGSRVQRRLLPGAELCVATWIKSDAAIRVRVGANEDTMSVSPDLGSDVRVEVTEASVRFLRPADRIMPWRACWKTR
jgi:hypothetical protein